MPPSNDNDNELRQPLLPTTTAAAAAESQPAATGRAPRRVSFAPSPSPPPPASSSSSSGSGAAPLPENDDDDQQPTPKITSYYARLKAAVRRLKHETLALYYAAHDPRTPWHARLLPAVAVAYALSPLDLIPDFIPVLGLVDDLLILPALLWLAIRALPEQVLEDARERARREPLLLHRNWPAAIVFFALWLLSAELLVSWLLKQYAPPELWGDRWAVLAGVAGLGCVAFSVWAVGRLRYDRRRRDAWNLSHSAQRQAVEAQQQQQDVEGGFGAGVPEMSVVEEAPQEEEAAAAENGWAAAAGGASHLGEEGDGFLPPALAPPASGAVGSNGVSHRRVSGDSGEEEEEQEEQANNNGAAVAGAAEEEPEAPPAPPPPPPPATLASPSPGKKRRSKPKPPPLPGSGDGDDAAPGELPQAVVAANGLTDAAPVLVPAAARRAGGGRR